MWGPIIAAGISAVGQLFANRQQQKFATEQSTTNYQRAVHDMQAAGLNPMLAYQQGGAPNTSISPQNPLATVGPAVGSALQYGLDKKSVAADVALKGQQLDNAYKTGRILDEQGDQARADTRMKNIDLSVKSATIEYAKEAVRRQLEAMVAGINLTDSQKTLADVQARIGKAAATQGEWEAERTGTMHKFGSFIEQFGGPNWIKFLPSALGSAVTTSAKALAAIGG